MFLLYKCAQVIILIRYEYICMLKKWTNDAKQAT